MPQVAAPTADPSGSTPGVAAPGVAASAPLPASPASPWPWITAGFGGAAMVTGGVIVVVGAQPWFAHASARQALQDAEKQASTQGVDELYRQQEQARADWVGFGQASVAAGLAFTVVGVLAAAGGVVWALSEGGEP
ncbi:MAG: hypothetical protein IT382_12910 [Deltaproteobacteria bacterium]|nr:hypothetical protein [Deltaproteobacteria bacterium]